MAVSEIPPYRKATKITPGTKVSEGRGVFIACTTAGVQQLTLAGGGTLGVPLYAGPSVIDNMAIIDAPTAGTTAVAEVYVLT